LKKLPVGATLLTVSVNGSGVPVLKCGAASSSNIEIVTLRASVPSSYVCVCDVFAGLAVMSSKPPSPQWMM
jgi:hypothetical protein